MSEESPNVYCERARRFRIMARSLAAQIKLPPDPEFDRASGLCVCSLCGLEYFDHPQLESGLFIVCEGSLKHL